MRYRVRNLYTGEVVVFPTHREASRFVNGCLFVWQIVRTK